MIGIKGHFLNIKNTVRGKTESPELAITAASIEGSEVRWDYRRPRVRCWGNPPDKASSVTAGAQTAQLKAHNSHSDRTAGAPRTGSGKLKYRKHPTGWK